MATYFFTAAWLYSGNLVHRAKRQIVRNLLSWMWITIVVIFFHILYIVAWQMYPSKLYQEWSRIQLSICFIGLDRECRSGITTFKRIIGVFAISCAKFQKNWSLKWMSWKNRFCEIPLQDVFRTNFLHCCETDEIVTVCNTPGTYDMEEFTRKRPAVLN